MAISTYSIQVDLITLLIICLSDSLKEVLATQRELRGSLTSFLPANAWDAGDAGLIPGREDALE